MDKASTMQIQGQRGSARILAEIRCGLLAILLLAVQGCINGPVRGRLNGRFNYLTAETARCAPWYTYPVSLPVAAVGDAGIIVADTLAVPVVALGSMLKETGPFFFPIALPFYPVMCFSIMVFSPGDSSIDSGVLYENLFGYRYIDTNIGGLKIASAVDSSGMPKTTIELNGRTIGDFSGDLKITALATEKDNLAIGLNDGTIRWWHSDDDDWSLKVGHFIPDRQKVLTAINAKLKWGILSLSPNEYKYLNEMKQEIEAGQPLKFTCRNLAFVSVEAKDKKIPLNQIRYSVSVICQSHWISGSCLTDGMNLHLTVDFVPYP